MPDKHISIEEALKRLDEQKREHDAMIEAGRLREAKENAWMNNPNPNDYTLFEWIKLWNDAHESDSIPTPTIPTNPILPNNPLFPEPRLPDWDKWLRRDKSTNDNPPTITTDHT